MIGTKIFASRSPAWTRHDLFGLNTVSADAPKIVHAVVTREKPRISFAADWNSSGMRASRSNTTLLDTMAATSDCALENCGDGAAGTDHR